MPDKIIRATGQTAELRFVLVDATDAANVICGYHGAQAFARITLGETIVSSLLLASGLKTNGTVQARFQFSGDFSMTTADATPLGLVRGMIPAEDIKRIGEFEPLLSPQIMNVRKLNENGMSISESIVEMPSENIGPSTAFYLLQSEQTKSAVGIKAHSNPEGSKLEFCGGFLVEALPKADEKTLAIMEQVVRNLPPLAEYQRPVRDRPVSDRPSDIPVSDPPGPELRDGGLDLEALLEDLAGPFRYTVHREIPVQPFCPCSEAGVFKALTGLPREDLEDVLIRKETMELHCEYCRKRYLATPDQVKDLMEQMDAPPGEDPDP